MFLNKTGRFRAAQKLVKCDSDSQYKPFQALCVWLLSMIAVLVCVESVQVTDSNTSDHCLCSLLPE